MIRRFRQDFSRWLDRLTRPAIFAAAFGAFFAAALDAASARSIAVVIGVSRYDESDEYVPDLDFVYNDAEETANVLVASRFEVKRVYAREAGERNNRVPTKANVLKTLKSAFSAINCSKDDVALVYFSGHGTSQDDRSRFILKDSNLREVDSQLYVQDVRDILKECPAERKILIIDACHAGGTRGSLARQAKNYAQENLEEGGVEGVVTLASCKVAQKSYNFPGSRQISLFTYWLVEGLKGYADVDGGETITISTDELFNYVSRNLDAMQALELQTPVVVKRADSAHFLLAQPNSRDLEQTLDDYAAHLVTQGEIRGVRSLQIESFDTSGSVWANASEQNQMKSIVDYCPKTLKKRIEAQKPNFKVSIGSGGRRPADAVLKSSLKRDETKKGGVYFLSSELYVDSQKAVEMPAVVRADRTNETNKVVAARGQENELRAAQAATPKFQIYVRNPNGTFAPRSTRKIGDADWIAFEPGEVYKIAFGPAREKFGVRVLVDGRDTLPPFEDDEESDVVKLTVFAGEPTDDETPNDVDSSAPAPADETSNWNANGEETPVADETPTLLDFARYWVSRDDAPWEIRGFAKEGREYAAEFTVADAAESLDVADCAAQMGLITVAFYELVPARRAGPVDVFTKEGGVAAQKRTPVNNVRLGKMVKCVQIRYATAAALDEYENSFDERADF